MLSRVPSREIPRLSVDAVNPDDCGGEATEFSIENGEPIAPPCTGEPVLTYPGFQAPLESVLPRGRSPTIPAMLAEVASIPDLIRCEAEGGEIEEGGVRWPSTNGPETRMERVCLPGKSDGWAK